MTDSSAVRLAHFSDIHLTASPLGWRPADLLTKRSTGWFNLKLGRGREFHDAKKVVAAMMAEIRQRGHHVLFSGDATTLGFSSEFSDVAHLLDLSIPGLAVPGNHDYYTHSAARSGQFERTFARWQQGLRIGAHIYPFAQQAGACWLIGVCSACPTTLPWDARGCIDPPQWQRLLELLHSLAPGPRILVTHYPLYQADGAPEQPWRLLRDWQQIRDDAAQHGVSLWLHGHRHGAYVLERTAERPFPIICAGSATQVGRWSWNEYIVEKTHWTMTRRMWQPDRQAFLDVECRTIELAP